MIGRGGWKGHDNRRNSPRAKLGRRHCTAAAQCEVRGSVGGCNRTQVRSYSNTIGLEIFEFRKSAVASRPNHEERSRQILSEPRGDGFVDRLCSLTSAIDEHHPPTFRGKTELSSRCASVRSRGLRRLYWIPRVEDLGVLSRSEISACLGKSIVHLPRIATEESSR